MDIVEEQQQASEVEVPSSPEQQAEEQPSEEKAPLSPSIAALKPPISHITDEKSAKIHLIDTIIYDTLASDAVYHTPASATIQKVYDSFGTIMKDSIDLTTITSDYNLINLVDFMKQAAVLKSSTPWGLSHQQDPISMFIVLDDITYGQFITTGSTGYLPMQVCPVTGRALSGLIFWKRGPPLRR